MAGNQSEIVIQVKSRQEYLTLDAFMQANGIVYVARIASTCIFLQLVTSSIEMPPTTWRQLDAVHDFHPLYEHLQLHSDRIIIDACQLLQTGTLQMQRLMWKWALYPMKFPNTTFVYNLAMSQQIATVINQLLTQVDDLRVRDSIFDIGQSIDTLNQLADASMQMLSTTTKCANATHMFNIYKGMAPNLFPLFYYYSKKDIGDFDTQIDNAHNVLVAFYNKLSDFTSV